MRKGVVSSNYLVAAYDALKMTVDGGKMDSS